MLKILSPITLRDTMVLKSSVIFSFNKILLHTDLPYGFDMVNKYWWRWYSDLYGFFYHRVKRTYSIWLTMALKKNIGIHMFFYMMMPNKRSKVLDKWKRRTFLYKNSLLRRNYNYLDIKSFRSLNFEHTKTFWLSDIAKYILFPDNKYKRSLGSFGSFGKELDMFFSTYNYKWNNLYKRSSLFYKNNRMPKNFMIAVNSFFMSSSFFINSFDSSLILYPQYFLEYHNKLYNESILSIVSFFNIKFNINLYINILIFIGNIYLNFIKFKFYKYVFLFINNKIEFNIYKINLYFYFIYFNIYINLQNYNKWFLYSIYLKNYNFYNFFLFKNYNSLSNYNLLYNNFFITFNKNYKSWIMDKRLKKNYNWKYDYFFKFLHKLYLYNQYNISNINKFMYLNKFYIFEVIYLWDIVKKKLPKFLNSKLQFQGKKFLERYNESVITKYQNIKSCFNILNFLLDLKNKFLSKNLFLFKSLFFIKPSLKLTKVSFVSLVKWLTNYEKIFIKVPELLNIKYNYKFSSFFLNNAKSNKITLFIKNSKKTLKNLKFFISKFFNIIIFNFRINFGLSYNLISFSKIKADIINLDNSYFFNIQHIICQFLLFFKTILGKIIYSNKFSSLLFLRKFNLYDKFFFSYIFFVKNYILSYFKLKTTNIYIYKHIKFKNLNFIGFSFKI